MKEFQILRNPIILISQFFIFRLFLIFFLNSKEILFYNLINGTPTSLIFLNHLNFFSYFPIISLNELRFGILLILFFCFLLKNEKLNFFVSYYLSFCFQLSTPFIEGGDQIASNLSLFLFFITFMGNDSEISFFIKNCLYFLMKLNISCIYFQAATSKLSIPEWVDGTAVYYWINNPTFGLPIFIEWFPSFIGNPLVITTLTWLPIILEILLSASIFIENYPMRLFLFLSGIFFHFSIMFIFNLPSFFITMVLALIIYFSPKDYILKNKQIPNLREFNAHT